MKTIELYEDLIKMQSMISSIGLTIIECGIQTSAYSELLKISGKHLELANELHSKLLLEYLKTSKSLYGKDPHSL